MRSSEGLLDTGQIRIFGHFDLESNRIVKSFQSNWCLQDAGMGEFTCASEGIQTLRLQGEMVQTRSSGGQRIGQGQGSGKNGEMCSLGRII